MGRRMEKPPFPPCTTRLPGGRPQEAHSDRIRRITGTAGTGRCLDQSVHQWGEQRRVGRIQAYVRSAPRISTVWYW
jgi:hypothetical protein